MGMVNGGLGLKLAANSVGGEIAWGVLSGVFGLTYLVVALGRRKSTGWGLPGMARKKAGVEKRGEEEKELGLKSTNTGSPER